MDTYNNLKKIIAAGTKTREQILSYMDVFLMNDRITQEQYNELVTVLAK